MLKRGSQTLHGETIEVDETLGAECRTSLEKSGGADVVYGSPLITPRATCRSPHGGRRNNGNLDEFREEIFTNTSIPWFLE